MPFDANQLVRGADYALATYDKKEPIDQINVKHSLLDWLVKNKKESSFLNGTFKEPVYITNNSNAQNFFGADQVTYNERDPARWTDFKYYNTHDGFWFDEDRLLAAGISISADPESTPSKAEKEALIDLLEQSYRAMKNSIQQSMAYEFLRDGTQSTKAAPGVASLISQSPAAGTIGGIAASNSYWQNNTSLAMATTGAAFINAMEVNYRSMVRFGGMAPDAYFCGAAFRDYFRTQANAVVSRQITEGNQKGGVSVDPSTNELFFHNVPVIWDPDFEGLDTLLATTTQTKTCYAVNKQSLTLRPVKGEWMKPRKPERLPDRYVHYFAKTAKYGLTINKRNSLSVLTIA